MHIMSNACIVNDYLNIMFWIQVTIGNNCYFDLAITANFRKSCQVYPKLGIYLKNYSIKDFKPIKRESRLGGLKIV